MSQLELLCALVQEMSSTCNCFDRSDRDSPFNKKKLKIGYIPTSAMGSCSIADSRNRARSTVPNQP